MYQSGSDFLWNQGEDGRGFVSAGLPKVIPAVIASGAALSGNLNFTSYRPGAIIMPSGWDAAVITFRISHDGTNFVNLYDKDGNEYSIQTGVSRAIMLPVTDFAIAQYWQIRSGLSSAAVNQTAQRTLQIIGV